ncbi:substrate-binding domain-containing protein [Gymnodinialimonas hymeniacidonis]|uniref:substrate-binding domain-containing protein n=1 Tax=Gymnodinialimonas hymeniacidonis TaxID=3126508 RepID=UPI0034C5CF7B
MCWQQCHGIPTRKWNIIDLNENTPVKEPTMSCDVIRVVLPVALKEVFDTIAPAFTYETGHEFDVALMLNPEVPAYIASGASWSIAFSNPEYLQGVFDDATTQGSVHMLAYSPLCLAERARTGPGQTVDFQMVADVLDDAETIALTKGGTSSAQFAKLVRNLGLTAEIEHKLRWLPGGGPAKELQNGKVGLAVLPLSNIVSTPGICPKVVCPLEMDVQVDLAFCVESQADAATREFVSWLTDATQKEVLTRLGLRQFDEEPQ